jgi:hypothetical protein
VPVHLEGEQRALLVHEVSGESALFQFFPE